MTPKPKEPAAGEREKPEDSTWAEDQRERGYYYDDAHGYEDFVSDDGSDDDGEGDDEDRVQTTSSAARWPEERVSSA